MDKLGKFLQRDLVNASPSRFLMDDVKENEMASSLPQNVTADYVRAIGSDGKSYRIPKADFASIIRSELGTILNGLSDQQTVTKVPTLNGATLGASAVATLASVLGDAAKKVLSTDWSNLYGSGLYYLYGDNTVHTLQRYALVAVNLTNQGYDLVVIGTSSDFGDSGAYNLIYQITNNGVQFKKGSGLPCYLIKLV